MKWLIEHLETQSCLYDFIDDKQKINDLKRVIEILHKKSNAYQFPKVMNFRQIEQRPNPPTQPTITTPLPKQNNIPVMYPGISPKPTVPFSAVPAPTLLNNYHEPSVGEEIFGIFNYPDGTLGQCIYTWQEKDNPKEIYCYALGMETNFSVGQTWMPCRKNHSDKYLIICTNECCKQPNDK